MPAQPAQPAQPHASTPSAKPPPVAPAAPSKAPVIVQLSTSDPSCGLDADGRVWHWWGGEMEPDAPSIRGAKSIVCAMTHSCIVAADGNAQCWGNNAYGALGNGNEKPHDDPVGVIGITSVAELSADYGRTCARTTNGDVYCWGDSEFGKAGDGRLPDNVGREKVAPGKAILTGASTLSVGSAHACSAMPDGRVSCWGQNNSGACGQPETTRFVPRPAFVPRLKDVVAVRAGASLTCTLDRAGAVACWGNASNGVLGPNGPRDDMGSRHVPVPIPLPGPAAELALGLDAHVCARLVSGAVYCWGGNEYGQLGDGTNTDRKAPVPVKGIDKAIRIAGGLGHTCALVEGGRVRCWGKAVMRPDPTRPPDDSAVPVEVSLPPKTP